MDGRCVPSPWAQSCKDDFYCNDLIDDGVPHLTVEGNLGAYQHQSALFVFGGKLEFRHTVESHRTGAPVDFFRCEDCGHIHTVEHRTPTLEATAKRTRA
jgi:hypothetical protein